MTYRRTALSAAASSAGVAGRVVAMAVEEWKWNAKARWVTSSGGARSRLLPRLLSPPVLTPCRYRSLERWSADHSDQPRSLQQMPSAVSDRRAPAVDDRRFRNYLLGREIS